MEIQLLEKVSMVSPMVLAKIFAMEKLVGELQMCVLRLHVPMSLPCPFPSLPTVRVPISTVFLEGFLVPTFFATLQIQILLGGMSLKVNSLLTYYLATLY